MAKKNLGPPRPTGTFVGPFFGAVLISFGIFLLLPLIQIIEESTNSTTVSVADVALPPPPPPPPTPPEEEIQEEEEMEEIQEDREPPSIEALELSLNSDISGAISGTVAVPDFNVGDTMEEIVFDIGDVDQRPQVVERDPRDYRHPPEMARRTGNVTVEFIVTKQGTVRDVKVIETSNPIFNKPVRDWVSRWRFTPGEKGGKTVEVRVRAPLVLQASR